MSICCVLQSDPDIIVIKLTSTNIFVVHLLINYNFLRWSLVAWMGVVYVPIMIMVRHSL